MTDWKNFVQDLALKRNNLKNTVLLGAVFFILNVIENKKITDLFLPLYKMNNLEAKKSISKTGKYSMKRLKFSMIYGIMFL